MSICDNCKKTPLEFREENKVLKDIGLRSGKIEVRIEKILCDDCYKKLIHSEVLK